MKPLNVVNGTSSIPGEIWNKIIDNRIPINASVFLTNDCNFKCRHCYVQSLKNKSQYPLSIDIWGRLLKKLKENGCIYLAISGGEVLSASYFLENDYIPSSATVL